MYGEDYGLVRVFDCFPSGLVIVYVLAISSTQRLEKKACPPSKAGRDEIQRLFTILFDKLYTTFSPSVIQCGPETEPQP